MWLMVKKRFFKRKKKVAVKYIADMLSGWWPHIMSSEVFLPLQFFGIVSEG